jgi:hypothetical protein
VQILEEHHVAAVRASLVVAHHLKAGERRVHRGTARDRILERGIRVGREGQRQAEQCVAVLKEFVRTIRASRMIIDELTKLRGHCQAETR